MKTLIDHKTTILFWLLLVFWSVGCTAEQPPPPTDPPAPSPTATVRPTATLIPTITPSPLPPTSTPTPAPLSPSAIFERVAPSIAYVETSLSSGSAILIEGNYLLTNAHVVWPFAAVRAVFPDGTEFESVPLLNWDQMADLAVLGPLPDASAAALPLVDGEASVVGSDVYLVGYPGEVDDFPEPSLTRGLISRKREWDSAAITYFQTDATIAGGQSGGALVSEMGEVIGLSGFTFEDGEFALVASAADLTDRVARLIAGEDTSGLGARLVDHTNTARNPRAHLRHAVDTVVYLVASDCGPTLEVEAESDSDIVLQLYDVSADESQEVDDGATGVEQLASSLAGDRTYIVAVYAYDNTLAALTIKSSCDLIPIADEDDETLLHVGDTTVGALDYPGDMDLFYLEMAKGEEVNFVVDSASIDPVILITYEGAPDDAWVEDDDSGGGLFGLDADLTFRTSHKGRYMVFVGDPSCSSVGGYSLAVSSERSGAPTPVALAPTPAPIEGECGLVQLYESQRYTIQIAEAWEQAQSISEGGAMATVFADPDHPDRFLLISEEDLARVFGAQSSTMTRAEYTSLVFENNVARLDGATLIWRQTQSTSTGLVVETAHYRFSQLGILYHLKSLVALEDGIGFNAVYMVPDDGFAELEPLIDCTFNMLALVE
jgi:S1-C subfamily serine protease